MSITINAQEIGDIDESTSRVSIADCNEFSAGPNTTDDYSDLAWTHVLTASTVADGAASQDEQTFTMNITFLPDGGAYCRIFQNLTIFICHILIIIWSELQLSSIK